MTDNNVSHRPLIAVAFCSFISMGLFAGVLGVAWPSMRLDFGVSLDAIGALLLFSMLVSLAISFSSGRLIATIGLGTLLVIGGMLGALSFLGNALAPSWWTLILMAAMASAGVSIINTGLNTYFAIVSTASLMNWLHAGFGLGATISPILVMAVLSLGRSWRWGYVVVAVSFAILSVLFFLTRKRWPLPEQESTETEATPAQRASYKDSLKQVAVWLSLLLFFTFTGLENTAGQWPYVLFTDARAVDPIIAGLWVSIFWASMTVGRLFFGVVIRYVDTTPLIRSCGAAIVVGAALVWLNPNMMLSFLGLVLVGFSVSPFFPVLASETPKRLGLANAANILGFQITAVRLGIAVVPALVGVWADAKGLEVIGLAMFVIAIAVVLLYELTLRKSAVEKYATSKVS